MRPAGAQVGAARAAAFDALLAVETADSYLNLTLPALLAARRISGRDAAFATELANGTMRLRGRYDAMIARCVHGGAGQLQPEVLSALRLGCHQLHGMRVARHAAVTTTVELVRRSVGERPVRLANAVLRRIAATALDSWLSEMTAEERWSHPHWIIDAFDVALRADGRHGTAELEALLAADNASPRVSLAVRPGLAEVADLARYGARPGAYSPYAATLPGGDPGSLAAVASGAVGVQDEGSQLAALVLARAASGGAGPGREERWLDMCAGPGGKSALLTGLAQRAGATLVAAERQPHRAALVAGALRGYPPPHAVVAADGTRPAWPAGVFDRVLVDAPCSGLGALRRRPEARWRRTPEELPGLVALQRRLLESAIASVRPGGAVCYVTCTPQLDETRVVVDTVLGADADLAEEDARALLPEVPDLGAGRHAQLWPHRHGTDAMFIAVLRRG